MELSSEIFADTWFWVALINKRDNCHELAIRTNRSIAERGGVKIVTSEPILAELLNYFSKRGAFWRERALQGVRSIQARAIVVSQDTRHFERSLSIYERFADKDCSLTDCSSFVIMWDRCIQHVITDDQDFERVGFILYTPS